MNEHPKTCGELDVADVSITGMIRHPTHPQDVKRLLVVLGQTQELQGS
jgi:hypothetical protein